MKKLFTVMAAALVVSVIVVALVVGARLGTRSVPRQGHDPISTADYGHVPMSRPQGLMPEVVSIAESPRLVMPTVEVHAFRSLAASDAAIDVY